MLKNNALSRLNIYPETTCFLYYEEPNYSLRLKLINNNTEHLTGELNNFYNWNLFTGEPQFLEDGSAVLDTYYTKIKAGVFNILENRYFSLFPHHLTLDISKSPVHTYLSKKTKEVIKDLLS